jgi:signal transduction histidine kinase
VVMTDITAGKLAEAQLRRANEELEVQSARLRETLAELEAFSYSVAHDMRAPLRAMQGFANLLLEDCGDQVADFGRDYIRRIVTSANRLDRLIQDVLQYSKVLKTELVLEPIAVERLIREVIDSYPVLQSARADVTIIKPLPAVLASEAALTQCISNLVGNAVKFVRTGNVPQIRIWAERRDGWVRLWFQDRGIGIEKEAQERIFQMFQRVDRSDQYDGTGIGLAIVRKAVERMGGQVGVESDPGEGSRFWLELRAA